MDRDSEGRRILLVRHGESTANVAAAQAERAGLEVIDVGARDADVELSPLGAQQAATVADAVSEKLGADWVNASRVWSSPYRRARETCRIALGGVGGFAVDERLRDRELGIIDALTTRGVDVRLPQEAARRRWLGKFYYRPPGGESWADVALRVRSFLRDAAVGPEPLVVFTHDAVVSLFVYVLLGLDEEQLARFLAERVVSNASVTSFVADVSGRWSLESFADASHIVEAGVPATEHAGTDPDGA
ncbi:histidine phosphatase family protein [Gryllotalpicola daejeonensis]|uniref:Histidine phosphatase family protein n=1 Tax=Gryllotalpicola daejeonensis TaxID=993087 RepID=A0ABP7ZK36_9MICO